MKNNYLKLGKTRGHLSFKIRFLLMGFAHSYRSKTAEQESTAEVGPRNKEVPLSMITFCAVATEELPKVMTFSKNVAPI